jgi:asparagine synthase (glutamine-hydrolysing)
VYRAIRKLRPAHVLRWRDGAVHVGRYWTPPAPVARLASEGEAVEMLDGLLARAVKRQLVSDVPLGAFLSGGVDSSLIVALMRETGGERVRTFSVGFEGAGLYDERSHARRVAALCQTEHVEEVVRPRPVDELARIVGAFDEPFADSSAVATYYLARIVRQHVTVALSGTGADDIFGGYRRYASARIRETLGVLPAGVRSLAAAAARRLPAGRATRAQQAVLFLQRATAASVTDDATWYAGLMTILAPDVLRALGADLRLDDHPVEAALAAAPGQTAFERYLWADFHTYLPDDLLAKEDRMTMAHGLEARVPYLDNDVMDFAWTLPPRFKVRGLRTKLLLKQVAARRLPPDIVWRGKHGFALPVSTWLRGELRELGAAALLDGHGSPLLDVATVRGLWDAHQRGEELGAPLWAVLVYRLWEQARTPRSNVVSSGAPA